jgi:hypothetical protein
MRVVFSEVRGEDVKAFDGYNSSFPGEYTKGHFHQR